MAKKESRQRILSEHPGVFRVEILQATLGSPDGIRTRAYQVGEIYSVPSLDMTRGLAEILIQENKARILEPTVKNGSPENRDLGASPLNRESPA